MLRLRKEDETAFLSALEKRHQLYDEEWKGPREYLERAGYHTRLFCRTVHGTRAAFSYASALLATGEEKDLKRAEEILWHAAALQDKDPANATYGIWSWYMEEPLSEMSPPDWNWADFCGKEILQVLAFHADRISHALYLYLEETLKHACLSIYRRNMHPGYTNISIMGSYVTLHAGQLLAWPWLFAYGKSRFVKFCDFTRQNSNCFAEYNSATYTAVAIEDLTRIFRNIEDQEVRTLAGEMLDIGWKTVSEHFHAPTGQWCGPNSRSYTWLTSNATLSFIEEGLGHEIRLTDHFAYDPAWAYIGLECPEKYREAFRKVTPHDVNPAFTTGPDINAPADNIACMHMEEAYSLSSWCVTSTWNQRRNLLGFWGGKEARFVSATILHDLYDFSSGMFTTAQDAGHALLLADLVDNGGDTHCNLDLIKNKKIRASDLRVRIEAGGGIGAAWRIEGNKATLQDGGLTLYAELLGAEYDGKALAFTATDSAEEKTVLEKKADKHLRFTGDERREYLDVIFYQGEEREIDLASLKNAFAGIYFSMDGVLPAFTALEEKDGSVRLKTEADGHTLTVEAPAAPVGSREWKGIAAKDGVIFGKEKTVG